MNKGAADFPQPLFKTHRFGKAGNDTRDVMCQHGPNRFFDLDGSDMFISPLLKFFLLNIKFAGNFFQRLSFVN